MCVSERKSKWNAEVPGSKGKESGVILKISFQQSRTMESLEKRRRQVETGGEQQRRLVSRHSGKDGRQSCRDTILVPVSLHFYCSKCCPSFFLMVD